MNYLIYGRKGCGKSYNAEKIQVMFNCTSIKDEGKHIEAQNLSIIYIDALAAENRVYLTTHDPRGMGLHPNLKRIAFDSIKDQLTLKAAAEEYHNMVRNLAKPGADIKDSLQPEKAHILHMAVGISGEVAELLEAVRDREDNVLEELGDIEFYFCGLCLGLSLNRPIVDYLNNGLYEGYDLTSLMIELVTCAGNILDKAKRLAIYNKLTEFERPELRGFMCEFRSILTCIYEHPDIDLTVERAKSHNMNKLLKGNNARYKSGHYSNAQANARADKA